MIATVYSWVAPVFFKVIAITIETKAFLMQSRKEMKKKQVRSQHFMLRAIASKMVRNFSGAGGHFPCLRGYHWTKRSWDRREVGGIERGAMWRTDGGKFRMAGYVFQGRLDVKMWSWLKCVYVHSFCMYPCMWYMSLHCHCPPNEWSSSTMPTMHPQEEVGHYETYRENHLMLWLSRWWFQIFLILTPIWGRFPFWLIFFKGVETTNQLFMFSSRQNHVKRPSQWKKRNCTWKKPKFSEAQVSKFQGGNQSSG